MAWNFKQKRRAHQYVWLARMPRDEYVALLHQVTGYSSAADPKLDTVKDFSLFMASIEAVLDWRHQEGMCPCPWTETRKRTYWRERLGKDTERQCTHRIYELWEELKTMLPKENRETTYLYEISCTALRGTFVKDIKNLKTWQQIIIIEALKKRIFQTRRTLAAERAGLPGANVAPEHLQDDCPDEVPDSAEPDEFCELGVPEPVEGVPF